jgi:23S rRNA (uracil1939-C5)-methyltransferase
VIEVRAERLAYGGDAVARFEGLAVFVPLAAPGDRLRVRITERKERYARAVILEIVSPSPSRRIPPCSLFGVCGGCQLQHLSYDAQIEAKIGFVRDALARIGRIEWPHSIAVRRAQEFQYRARAQIKVEEAAIDSGGELRIGFNKAGSRSVCDVADCLVLVPELNNALKDLRTGLKLAKTKGRKGLPEEIEMAAARTTVAVSPRVGGLGAGAIEHIVRGAGYRFSVETFFQVNPFLLDDLVREAVDGAAGRLAIDLYAGVGLFTIQLARSFDRVVGVESDPVAAGFARENIAANKAANIEFHNERVEAWLKRSVGGFEKGNSERPDIILLDPPRGGASEAIPLILDLRPKRITYVACDPTTLARDLGKLVGSAYKIEAITALDLFPQTYHIETVVKLSRS